MSIQFGIIGLGKMGKPLAEKLLTNGHAVVAYNRSPEPVAELVERSGAIAAESVQDLVRKLESPRIVWIMVPAGEATDDMIAQVSAELSEGDIIVDGGNANYNDTILRSKELAEKGMHLLDCGTSGGVYGGEVGFSLMIGGTAEAFAIAEPYFKTLAAPQGAYGHFGPSGGGHFVKMIHNGIEYGMMQAIGEGLAILNAKKEFNFDLADITRVWSQGSVIRSWLIDLTEQALRDDSFESIKDYVQDSGEGRWTVQEAEKLSVPAPILTLSLIERFASRVDENFAHKISAALRNQFGGHAVEKK